jgi:hypothetical protein
MNDLNGMTVNERLFATGLLGAWDEAIKRRDTPTMRAILAKIRSSGSS